MAPTGESVVYGSKARPQDLPSMDKLLRLPAVLALPDRHSLALLTRQARSLPRPLIGRIGAVLPMSECSCVDEASRLLTPWHTLGLTPDTPAHGDSSGMPGMSSCVVRSA